MNTQTQRNIKTPENEFPKRKQELFNLYLKMPVKFKKDWNLFKKKCREHELEFEDVLGSLIIRFCSDEFLLKEMDINEFKKEQASN